MKLRNDNLSLLYQGVMDDSLTDKIIRLSESSFESLLTPQKVSNKISFIMFECFQNIIRHGHDKDYQGNFFMTRALPSVTYISSANFIENKHIENIKDAIVNLNKLDKNELKELYINNLSGGELSKKGGAGLGLIEMARKSGNKLDFDFIPFNNDQSYFFLSIKMKNNEKDPKIPDEEKIELSQIIELQQRIIKEGIIIAFKCDFSENTIVPILKMIESNTAKNKDITANKTLIYTIIELSQNISKHSYKEGERGDGLLTVSVNDDNFYISATNLIENNEAQKLKEKLEMINNFIPNEIENQYRKALQESILNKNGKSAGIGLLDLANIIKQKYRYHFTSYNDSLKLFTISINI
ncbi:MAG: SiaB family protein kinase [Bacteroidota bacterium]